VVLRVVHIRSSDTQGVKAPAHVPYREIGSFRNLRLVFTPEALLWYNNSKTQADERRQFLDKVWRIFQDVRDTGRPRLGKVKMARACEVPVHYLRLSKDQRIFFDYRKQGEGKDTRVEILVLAVANKSNFQARLNSSAEHKVHASSFDGLAWSLDNGDLELDLETASSQEVQQFSQMVEVQFQALSKAEQDRGWSRQLYLDRATRATIYDFRLPHVSNFNDYTFEEKIPEILKLQPIQEQMLEENRDIFLLEGVAGTGKTTILMYRFAQYARAQFDDGTFDPQRTLFVTHNERLRDEVRLLLAFFFKGHELESARSCIKSVDDAFRELLPKDASKFPQNRRLTREAFRRMMRKASHIDIDLLWEEYRGVLRGYNLRGSDVIVSEEMYLEEIGRRRGRINVEERRSFYKQALDFQNELSRDETLSPETGGWDDLSICVAVLEMIQQSPSLRRVDFLFIDEVQDLTTAELIVFFNLLDPDGFLNIAVAGDLSQSVQPSAFTWASLRESIHDELGISVESEYRLDENFRSTPYLVHAANNILELLSAFKNEAITKLQRPFSGENNGEPMQLFYSDEASLLQHLSEHNLPNQNCVLLVRDSKIKRKLELFMDEKNAAFVETIAKFKGLEQENILLWDPGSGSEGLLDLLYHPQRGEQARKSARNFTTGIIELKHLFVGFTRARYLLGVCLPGGPSEQHFFTECIESETYSVRAPLTQLDMFASLDVDEEIQMERASAFLQAGKFRMAAEVYRNLGEFQKFHYYLAEYHKSDLRFPEAVREYSASIDEGGDLSQQSRSAIASIALLAIEDASDQDLTGGANDDEISSEEIARLVRVHAGPLLDVNVLARMEGDMEEKRGNYDLAARHFIDANLELDAFRCIRRVENRVTRTSLLLYAGHISDAGESYRDHLRGRFPEQSILIALYGGADPRSQNLFPAALDANTEDGTKLSELRSWFKPGNTTWAKELARATAVPSRWLKLISDFENEKFLSKKPSTTEEARKQFDLLVSIGEYDRAFKRVKEDQLLVNQRQELEFQLALRTHESKHEVLEVLSQILQSNAKGESTFELDKLIACTSEKSWVGRSPQRMVSGFRTLIRESFRRGEKRVIFVDDQGAERPESQRLIVSNLLAAYLEIARGETQFELKEFFDLCRLRGQRNDQPIVAACASMICLHIADVDHPLAPDLRVSERVAAMMLFERYSKKKMDRDTIFSIVLSYSLGSKYRSSPPLDNLNVDISTTIQRLSGKDREWLYSVAIQHLGGRLDKEGYHRLPNVLKREFHEKNASFIADALEINRWRRSSGKQLPKLNTIELTPSLPSIQNLENSVNKQARWIATYLSSDPAGVELWLSVFHDGDKNTSMSGFIEAIESVEAEDKPPESPHESTQSDVSGLDEALTDVDLNDVPDENDVFGGEEDPIHQDSAVSTDNATNLEDAFAQLDFDNVEVEIPTLEASTIADASLYEQVRSLDETPNGRDTLDVIQNLFLERLPHDAKSQSDALARAFKSVFIMPWPEHFKMAVILVIKRWPQITERGDDGLERQYLVLDESNRREIASFANSYKRDILNSKMAYAMHINGLAVNL
jgi:hypothetical protein